MGNNETGELIMSKIKPYEYLGRYVVLGDKIWLCAGITRSHNLQLVRENSSITVTPTCIIRTTHKPAIEVQYGGNVLYVTENDNVFSSTGRLTLDDGVRGIILERRDCIRTLVESRLKANLIDATHQHRYMKDMIFKVLPEVKYASKLMLTTGEWVQSETLSGVVKNNSNYLEIGQC